MSGAGSGFGRPRHAFAAAAVRVSHDAALTRPGHAEDMKRLIVVAVAAAAAVAAPLGGATAVSPTVRLAIVHYVSGCHVWQVGVTTRGSAAKITVRPGTRVELRASCPMDFDVAQVAGPRLGLGPPRLYAGTTRAIVFRKAGVYRLTAKNVQSSEQQGLQTLGPDNGLTLTVIVRNP